MNARFATTQLGSCAAYGCPSARIRPILDAANALVVSICVAVVRISG